MGIAVLCGLAFGLGASLLVASLRPPPRPRPPLAQRLRPDRALLRAVLAATIAVAVQVATGWPAAAAWAGVAGAAVPSLATGRRARAAELARIEAIATWAEMLRDLVRAGNGLSQAIAASARVAPAPLRAAVVHLAQRLGAGERPEAALGGFAHQVGDGQADFLVKALVLAYTRGAADITRLLDNLARTTRERAGMRLRVEGGRARVRTTARAAAAVALGWLVLIFVTAPGFFRPYDTTAGQVVLAAVGACFAASFWLISRMGRVPPSPRLLLAHPGGSPS